MARNGAERTWLPVLVHSARTAVAAVVSVLVSRLFRLPETYWAPITTVVIAQSSLGAAFTVSLQRFVGTALGATVGAIAASHFGPNLLVFGISVFILGLLCAVVHPDRSAYRFGGRYAGDCAVDSADGSGMADRPSSVRRSVHRNRGSVDIGVGVAGEGSHNLPAKVNSFNIPSARMAS